LRWTRFELWFVPKDLFTAIITFADPKWYDTYG